MLGFGKKKPLAGAKMKLENARRLRKSGAFSVNYTGDKNGGDGAYPSQTVAIAIIYAISIVVSIIASAKNVNPFSGMHITGIPSIDDILTGTSNLAVLTDPQENQVATIFLRGTVLFVIAGIAPLFGLLLERFLFRKSVMPIVLCWGIIVTAVLFYLFGGDILSLVKSL